MAETSHRLTNKEIFDSIRNTNLLSDATKELYMKRLSTVLSEFRPIRTLYQQLLDPNGFRRSLDEYNRRLSYDTKKRLSAATLAQFYGIMSSILIHHEDVQEDNPELLSRWKDLRREVAKPVDEHYDSNEPNGKQERANMSWDDIVKVRDSLKPNSYEKLLVSMYTMISPVRSDLDLVELHNKYPKNKDEGNHIVLGKINKMILNDYKTSKNYHTIEIDLPEELISVIKASLEAHPRHHLFVTKQGKAYDKPNTWNAWANRKVKKIFDNKDFTLTMFRHIYLSRKDLDLGDKTRKEKGEIAKNMQHSIDMQNRYEWKDKKKESD